MIWTTRSGGCALAEYKLYCLDRNDRIEKRIEFEAADDAAAMAYARDNHPGTNCELWCGARKVALIPAEGRSVA